MAGSATTLKDVAARVGVHLSTVSRVLNPATRGLVSDAIAQKIERAAAEMGYRPNPFAYSLKTNKSLTVGIVIPDLANPVFPPIIRGIESTLRQAGYNAIIADSANDPDEERLIIENLNGRKTDGLILATAHRADDLIHGQVLRGQPVVLVNRLVENEVVSSVTNDEVVGIRQVVDHIVKLGHQKVAHIAGPQSLSTGKGRYLAFKAAMLAHRLDADDDLIQFCDSFTEEEGRRALHALLDRRDEFTAVIAGNDMLALGCYDALQERGLSCPQDMSITGFNDMPFVDKIRPPLTTVRIKLFEMGVCAARALLELMKESPDRPRSKVLKPELIVRGSTAPPARRL